MHSYQFYVTGLPLHGGSVEELRETGMRQLRAVAKREYRRADTKVGGHVRYCVTDK